MSLPDLPPRARLPLLLLAMAGLVGGVLAGLARLGWPIPALAAQAAGVHGALMIAAFFGTVISLERAVALGRGWAYGAPLVAGLSGIFLLLGGSTVAIGLNAMAAGLLVLASHVAHQRQPALHGKILLLGAACWLAGTLVWLGSGNPVAATPGWLLFLILTIAGERLELTRFLPTPESARHGFVGIVILLIGTSLMAAFDNTGLRGFGLGCLLLALWLLIYDIARRNIRLNGLPRFVAACLLGGYGWLALGGLLGLAGAFSPGHPWRDAALHAIALGFVLAMVFGHAPIIVPAVMRIRIAYHPVLYLPLALLHLGLALRVGGVLLGKFPAHAGLFNALTLIVFVVTLLSRIERGRSIHA